MGCFWSNEGHRDSCLQCGRRAVNNLVIIDYLCECCTGSATRAQQRGRVHKRACYGEYRCSSCGRWWSSRLSWTNSYQICKRCRGPVYPHTQRELRPSDRTSKDNVQEHQKDLCQMCQQLGYYCGNYDCRLSLMKTLEIQKETFRRHITKSYKTKEKIQVTLRELRPSDKTSKDNVLEHQKDLCQICQKLGDYCGNFGRNKITKKVY